MNVRQRSATKTMTIVLVALALIFGVTVVSAYKARVSTVRASGLSGVYYFEDFVNAENGTVYSVAVEGTGDVRAEPEYTDSADESRSTLILLQGNADNDVAALSADEFSGGTADSVYVSPGTVTSLATEMAFKSVTVGVTGDFAFSFGMQSSGSPATSDYGSWFLYDKTISDNWQIVRAINGTASTTVTTVPASVDWTRLKMIVTNSRTIFYIDGIAVGNVATGGDSNMSLAPVYRVEKTGGGSVNAVVDYVEFTHQFATPRPTP